MKILKFKPNLVPLVLSGEKYSTWRFFDDKDLKEGDELQFMNSETDDVFSAAVILSPREKKIRRS